MAKIQKLCKNENVNSIDLVFFLFYGHKIILSITIFLRFGL